MAAKYPPFVNAYGNIPKLFQAIKDASVPPKFTNDFLTTTLGLKSSSYRAMIPLLKRLKFIDQANVPTQAYKDFRGEDLSGAIMAERLRDAYSDLFAANEHAYNLRKQELQAKLKTITGSAAADPNISSVVGTFLELTKLADFESKAKKLPKEKESDTAKESDSTQPPNQSQPNHPAAKLGVSAPVRTGPEESCGIIATKEVQECMPVSGHKRRSSSWFSGCSGGSR